MSSFIQLLVLGMATGGFYTINALGVVVVFRSSGIINFASGGVAMVGGYLEWEFADQLHWPHVTAVLLAVALSALLGALIHLFAIRPLAAASTLAKVIATLGVLVSLEQLVFLVFGGVPRLPTAYLPTFRVQVGSVGLSADSLILLAFTALLTVAMWLLYRYSAFGLATSALAENPRALAALGWRVGRLRTANWAIGGALAGLAGAGLGPILQLNGNNFGALIVPTLASAIIGGLRSFPLTLAGGVLLGAIQAEASRFTALADVGQALPFLLIIGVLVLRGRSLPIRSFVQERLPRVGSGEIRVGRTVVAVLVVGILGSLVTQDWVIGATLSLITALVLLSQVVITGYAGQLSLAQLTMAGIGAIVAANVAASWHLPFLVDLLAGLIAVVPVSLLVGLPSLRARGVSLAIATLGFGVAINAVVLNNSDLSGGLAGLTLDSPSIFGISIDATEYPRRFFYVTLIVFTLFAIVVANLRRGRSGRRMLAVRSNERAAAALGIGVTGIKLYAFVVAGVIAAAAGVLLVFRQSLPQFSGFDPMSGLATLIAGVLGGVGYILGTLIGGLLNNDGLPNAILNPLVGGLSWWTEALPLATGVLLIVQLALNPHGLADVITHGPARVRKRLRRNKSAPDDGLVPATTNGGMSRTGRSLHPARLRALTPEVSRAHRIERRRQRNASDLAAAAALPRQHRCGVLDVRDIRVVFGRVKAVDGVSFTLNPGEVLAIIGPNGAGKTTLMDAVTGFVSMAGTVEMDGRRIDAWPVHRRARAGISRSFQTLELLEDMTVLDNLRCAADPQDHLSLLLDLFAPGRGGLTAATAAAISTFDLADKLEQMPTDLAYGERRLVSIARAVAAEPSVLFLDEPAAGLSELERGEVSRLITMLAREWGIAVLLIEHDVALVRRTADRVIALEFGRPIASGTPDEVLAHPAVIQAYLGVEVEPAVVAEAGGPGPTPATTSVPASMFSHVTVPSGARRHADLPVPVPGGGPTSPRRSPVTHQEEDN